jgi:tetratricopeptide (TPR) repeat protein
LTQISLLAALAVVAGPKVTSGDWMPLVRAGEYQKAKSVCEPWLVAEDSRTKAEAHKCLANVELGLAGGSKVRIEGDRKAGGFIGPAYDDEASIRAVEHLNQALLLAPQDLSIHQGRLHVLMLAARYSDMERALAESAKLYEGADAMDAWLAYPAELFNSRQFKPAIALLLVLDKRYPNDHRVAGNMSAAYAMLEQDDEALAWASKAVKLAPDDAIDNWNLARIYDYTGKTALADAAYQKSLALQSGEQRKRSTCIYAEFVLSKKKDSKNACELQKQGGCSPSACQ